jgi:hypothetical protein
MKEVHTQIIVISDNAETICLPPDVKRMRARIQLMLKVVCHAHNKQCSKENNAGSPLALKYSI